MYDVLKQFGEYGKRIIVTENGAAFEDQIEGDFVHDARRLIFTSNTLAKYFAQSRKVFLLTGTLLGPFRQL